MNIRIRTGSRPSTAPRRWCCGCIAPGSGWRLALNRTMQTEQQRQDQQGDADDDRQQDPVVETIDLMLGESAWPPAGSRWRRRSAGRGCRRRRRAETAEPIKAAQAAAASLPIRKTSSFISLMALTPKAPSVDTRIRAPAAAANSSPEAARSARSSRAPLSHPAPSSAGAYADRPALPRRCDAEGDGGSLRFRQRPEDRLSCTFRASTKEPSVMNAHVLGPFDPGSRRRGPARAPATFWARR